MNRRLDEARLAVQKARAALRNDDRSQARQWAEKAAALAPQLEDPWLVLAAVASPRASLEYVQRALKINPNSGRARRGMEWALQRLRTTEIQKTRTVTAATAVTPSIAGSAATGAEQARRPSGSTRRPVLAVILLAVGSIVFAAAGWSASTSPLVASILQSHGLVAEPARPASWATVPVAKPTYTPAAPVTAPADVIAQAATSTPELVPTPTGREADLSTALSTELPTDLPTALPTDQPIETAVDVPTAEPTSSASLSLEYVEDTPAAEVPVSAPAATAALPAVTASGEHWIDVNLSEQTLYAYAGDTVVNSFLVSTGTSSTPTVTGQYHIYVQLRYSDMSGPGYYLPNVPYVMFFYKDYGLHGTYWHHDFGTPVSHGCVNLSIPDAAWLYNFASVGTLVNLHY